MELDFLFLDRAFSKNSPSLAMRFWPELDGVAQSMPENSRNEAFGLRWNYLSRLWPESTPDMFVKAFEQSDAAHHYVNIPLLPETIPAVDQFEIYQCLLEYERARVEKIPAQSFDSTGTDLRVYGNNNILTFSVRLFLTPCESAAKTLLDELTVDPKHPWWARLPTDLAYDTQHEDLLRLIAEGGDARLQPLILPAIEHHPTVKRQALLEVLQRSVHTEVRDQAAAVKVRLENLHDRHIPVRTIPDAPVTQIDAGQ